MTTILAGNASFEKLVTSLRHWMLGRGYHRALKAMEYASQFHTGTRKDGTPEFSHQIWQAHYIRTIEATLIDPELCLVIEFLHDTIEDHPVTLGEVANRFGQDASEGVNCMSKVIFVTGFKKPAEVYFGELSQNPHASICKGVDRIHNHQSMIGAFSDTKQISYMDETTGDILPMLKRARSLFPEQGAAYENIKHFLMCQMELLHHALPDQPSS